MERTLEQILAQEDPQMVAEARRLTTEMLLDIEKEENMRIKEAMAGDKPQSQGHASRR